MIDRVKIYVKAGDGGSGCNSFKGMKFTRSRRSDGGSGGRGADVIIKVDKDIQTLNRFQIKKVFRAENGKNGEANKKKGADGRPFIIKVPAGTIVYDLQRNLFLRDLINSGEQLVVAQGGSAGKGNSGSREATAGLPGEEKHLSLELKLVADIAIVGYPNSGKSTFLSYISSAHPKIAEYPFTTVEPFLGVLKFSDFEEPALLTVIEIPPIVKDAHKGKGLGIEQLRHAERAAVLLHLVDISSQERDVFQEYQNLNQELKFYSKQFFNKPKVLVTNKMDLVQAKENLEKFSIKVQKEIYPVSSITGFGIERLLKHLRSYFQKQED